MASPQRENGFTGVAHEIMEALCRPGMSGSELRIVLFILRKTYGYNKKQDRISLSQFEAATLMNRAQAVRTIKELLEKRIIVRDGSIYKLNKNYEEWVVSKRSSIQKDTPASIQKDTESSIQKDTHKRKKENITKETSKKGSFDPLGAEIIKAMELIDPKNKTYYNNTAQRAACDFLLKEYGLQEVINRIAVLPTTNALPYFPAITTPVQLRDKWVQLESTAKRKQIELQAKAKIAFQ